MKRLFILLALLMASCGATPPCIQAADAVKNGHVTVSIKAETVIVYVLKSAPQAIQDLFNSKELKGLEIDGGQTLVGCSEEILSAWLSLPNTVNNSLPSNTSNGNPLLGLIILGILTGIILYIILLRKPLGTVAAS